MVVLGGNYPFHPRSSGERGRINRTESLGACWGEGENPQNQITGSLLGESLGGRGLVVELVELVELVIVG